MAATDIDKLLIYRRSDDGELVPLVSPTTRLGANSTGSATGVPIGFDFHFDGLTFDTIHLFAYGFARLAGSENSATNANLFASSGDMLLAPWWDQLETADTVGYLKTEVQGTAPWRRLVVEWYCNLRSGQTGSDYDRAKFQLVIYETTGKFEFRYGDIETAGSPSRGSYGASCGFKGDTTSTTDNYRDVAVDDRELGGSKTTSTANLDLDDYNAMVGVTVVVEPNWPMCGRYVHIGPQQLTGLQHPYGEPIWRLANNVNWLYCRHAPPLVNFAPHGTYSGVMRYAIPVTPSADDLTYRVYVITYSSAGGDLDLTLDIDDDTNPQPDTDADWFSLTSPTATGTSSGYHDWTEFTCDIPSTATQLRVTVTPTSGQVYLGHILIVPDALADIDETASYNSGFIPMGLGQIRQRGAAVHPELYNRAWANVANIVNDRRQMAFSYGRGDHADAGVGSTGGKRTRLIGVSPCGLSGWKGATLDLAIIAYNVSSDGGALQLVERGGDGKAWVVDSNGDEFRKQTGTLQIASDVPVLTVTATPVSELRVAACVATWVPGWSDDDLFAGTTPAPSLEKLITLANRIARACTMSYAMTGIATPLERVVGGGQTVQLRWQIPAATKAMRPMIARINNDVGATAIATAIVGISSGATGDDIIVVPNPHSDGAEAYPWDVGGGDIQIASGAEVYDATPTEAIDRLLESPTATTLEGPEPEKLVLVGGAGMCLVCYPVDPASL